nr:hypothetical protein [Tanacetum cinerariifolium]
MVLCNANTASTSNENGTTLSFTNKQMMKLMNLINDVPSGNMQANIAEPNDVRRTTIGRLRYELVADGELANNLLHELNRYLEQLCTRALELLRVEALPDNPLIKYDFSVTERASFFNMTNSNNFVAVRTELLRIIADMEQMINHY